MEKPLYELYIDARGCYFELLVNGVPVYFYYNIGAVAFRLPINNYIAASGEQNITLRMISVVEGKPFPIEAGVTLSIDKYPKDPPKERERIFDYTTPAFDENNKGVFMTTKTFKAEIPYQMTDWRKGVDLKKEDEDALQAAIEKIYQTYTLALKNKDLVKYKVLTKVRQENMFTSMYFTKAQIDAAKKNYVNGYKNETVRLYPLESYKLVFYADNRLVGLRLPKEAPGILVDNEVDGEGFMEYILFYRAKKGDPLTIIF